MPDHRTRKVAVLVGSLRQASLTRAVAMSLMRLAPPCLDLALVEIGNLPLYNQDLEGNGRPAAWIRFREEIEAADALLFVTPEYNRSVPGLLKNAVDVGSRPRAENVWNAKPAAIVSVSPGALGGFGAHHHLRQILVCVNVPVMVQPEAYIGGANKLFDAGGEIRDPTTATFFSEIMTQFADWIDLHARSREPSPSEANGRI